MFISFSSIFIFIISIIFNNISCKMDASKVIAAINCGGDEYTDSNGITYDNDKYFLGGTSSDHGLNYHIKNTEDEILYQTERWCSETLTYSIPLKSNINGKYVLNLKFSEDENLNYLSLVKYKENKEKQKAYYIFLLDQSGSMSGDRINLSCKSLLLFLQSLNE